jgi:hypothetical protein
MMTILSDNEIAAVLARSGESWPGPLPTVILHEAELLQAALSGVRSLVERDLATMHGIDYSVDEDVRQLVHSVVVADVASSVHVAEEDHPGQLRGSSAYLYSGPSGAVIDLLTIGGVHNLSRVDFEAGVGVLSAAAGNVFRNGIEGPADSAPAMFARSSVNDSGSIRITKGQMSSGSVVGDGAASEFAANNSGPSDTAELESFLSGLREA